MINTKAFCAALKYAAHAQAKQDIRHYLKGVLFEFRADRLTLVGCDGVRMAVVELPGELPGTGEFIVSSDSIKHILALFGKDALGELTFELSGTGFLTTSSFGTAYKPVLVDGKFPDWRRIVPAESREQGLMPALDGVQLAAASAALAPLTEKYKGCVPLVTNASGESNAVKLRPGRIGVLGIEAAFAVLMPIRN